MPDVPVGSPAQVGPTRATCQFVRLGERSVFQAVLPRRIFGDLSFLLRPPRHPNFLLLPNMS